MDLPGIPNRLLAALPNRDRQRLIARSHEARLTVGEVLCTPGAPLLDVHFPLSGIIATQVPFGHHSSLQVELAGTEGMVGLPLVFGVSTATLQSSVQCSGTSLRLTAAGLRQELAASRSLRDTLGRYACVLRAQLAETAGCNSFHLLEARLARWLLATLDRADSSSTIHLTHELLGRMLGVRRESVTTAASQLQKRKLMRYWRGDITIIDRVGLEKVSCQCYQSAKNTYERFLGR